MVIFLTVIQRSNRKRHEARPTWLQEERSLLTVAVPMREKRYKVL